MSRGGKLMPELGDLLDRIAGRAEAGAANETDWQVLRRLAQQARDADPDWRILVHQKKPGQRRKGAAGVDERLELARLVQAHRKEHGGNLNDAYRAVSKLPDVTVGPDSLEKAWKEMRHVVDMSEGGRTVVLFFKRLKARGFPVIVERKR